MNISPELFYWITRLDCINGTFGGLSALMFVVGVFIGGLYFIQCMDNMPKNQREVVFVRRLLYSIVAAFLTFWLAWILIPTTNQAKQMIGYEEPVVKECNCNE